MDDTPPPSKPRRRRVPLIGPLFLWDLVRLARRGQDARNRALLAFTLLLTLLGFTMIWFRTTDLQHLLFGDVHQGFFGCFQQNALFFQTVFNLTELNLNNLS